MFRIRRLVPACACPRSPCCSPWQARCPPRPRKPRRRRPHGRRSRHRACDPEFEVPRLPRRRRDEERGRESVAVHEAQFAVSAHKRVACVECHTAALDVKHKGKRQPLGPVSFDVCMECHEDEITPFQNSVHARVKGGKPVTCQGCHGSIHTVVRSNNPAAPMAPLNQVRNCGVCHEEMMEGYLSSVHAQVAVRLGTDRRGALVQRLPRQPRHPAPHGRRGDLVAQEEPGDVRRMPQGHPQGVERKRPRRAVARRQGRPGVHHLPRGARDQVGREHGAMRAADAGRLRQLSRGVYKTFHDSFHGKATEVGHGSRPSARTATRRTTT